ncbi:hypothetical protein GJ744_012025 [Endocarpon pusillum]|uniref:Uncharacterized protein n=1 Tax=Endocarpon pusillum TaxID=364733 RepID=A0A8H7E8A3_9EURO|nr:hypothetical protein GJ744_012025 [Endocarpon pusillum]
MPFFVGGIRTVEVRKRSRPPRLGSAAQSVRSGAVDFIYTDWNIQGLAGLEHTVQIRQRAESGIDGIPVFGRRQLDGGEIDAGGVGDVDRRFLFPLVIFLLLLLLLGNGGAAAGLVFIIIHSMAMLGLGVRAVLEVWCHLALGSRVESGAVVRRVEADVFAADHLAEDVVVRVVVQWGDCPSGAEPDVGLDWIRVWVWVWVRAGGVSIVGFVAFGLVVWAGHFTTRSRDEGGVAWLGFGRAVRILALEPAQVDGRSWLWWRRIQVAVIRGRDGGAERWDLPEKIVLGEITCLSSSLRWRTTICSSGIIATATSPSCFRGQNPFNLCLLICILYRYPIPAIVKDVLAQKLAKRHHLLSPVVVCVAPSYLHRHESSPIERLFSPVRLLLPPLQGWPMVHDPCQDHWLLHVVHMSLEVG